MVHVSVANPRKRRLLENRQTSWEAMKKIMDEAESRGVDLSGADLAAYEQHEADIQQIETQLGFLERHDERAESLEDDEPRGGRRVVRTEPDEASAAAEAEKRNALLGREWRSYLQTGRVPTSDEFRALQAESDIEGGYLLAPQTQAAILLQSVKDLMFIRQIAHVETIDSSVSLGVPSLDTDLSDASWTGEIVAATEDSALRLGRREMKPNYLSKLVKLSRPLVRRTGGGAEALVRDRLAYKFALTQEKGFLSGNGNGQPLGLFTASNDGIGTARDISTGNSTTAIGADGLIECKHNLKGQYWARAQWLLSRTAVKNIRTLKDGNGQYLWSPGQGLGNGLSSGNPAMIVDSPYFMSENVPSTFTTGQYVGLIGDFEYYWILDVLGFDVQVLLELYAATNQIGYIGRVECDGMPVLAEAFSRLALA